MNKAYEKTYGGQREQTTTSWHSLPALPWEKDEVIAFKMMMAVPLEDGRVRWVPFD